MFLRSSSRRHPRLNNLALLIALVTGSHTLFAQTTEFNTQLLGISQGSDIDLARFARPGYVAPGTYTMMVRVNRNDTETREVRFDNDTASPEHTVVCMDQALINLIGLRPEVEKHLAWNAQGCADMSALTGFEAKGDLPTSTLRLNIPDTWLEYNYPGWEPPSRWDNGISGLLVDYNLNVTSTRSLSHAEDNGEFSGIGTLGANIGAWRLRADWQGSENLMSESSRNRWDWNRIYAFRPLPSLGAKLTLGEDYYGSGIFDSFRYTGASLVSDDRMLPPSLRGYSPEITGVARTNASVIISQQGRILVERQVAAGPFNIRDISSAVNGQLDVVVKEQDGTEQKFSVQTANIPYLTRPGQIRYKLVAGDVSDYQRNHAGNVFTGGELSWGVSNGWSLYGGLMGSGDYQALATGIGRDLFAFGAISADVTQSRAALDEGNYAGKSWRVNYSKRFDEFDSQVTFAGYRFSEREFMSLQDYTHAKRYGYDSTYQGKEMYTVSFNKQFRPLGLSASVNYSHQTYWNREVSNNVNVMLSAPVSIGPLKNASASLSVYQNDYYGQRDNGGYLSLSVPWSNTTRLSYNLDVSRDRVRNAAGVSLQTEQGGYYQLNAGVSREGEDISGYYSRDFETSELNLSGGYQSGRYLSAGAGLRGGFTLTPEGGALHRQGSAGGTRLLVDTGGVSGIPLETFSTSVHSNRFGKAVVPDVSHYRRNMTSVDAVNMPEDAEVISPVVHSTLTEGAIGYRKFSVISGRKAMVIIRQADGTPPPFGASVHNADNLETGIVGDEGSAYVSGIRPGEKMTVSWGDDNTCVISFPESLPDLTESELFMPCSGK